MSGFTARAAVGKTHLLQALCAQRSATRSAAYVPLREVAHLSDEMLSGYGQFALVCLDDAEAVAGTRAGSERCFACIRSWTSGAVAGRVRRGAAGRAAVQLRDLASRLNGGLVLTLQPLDEQEQIAALQLRAQLRGFELPDETAQFLLRRLPRDMASLCAFLDELDEASLVAQRRLTVPFVKAVMNARA